MTMRWPVFAIFVYLFASLDVGLAGLLQLAGIRPSFMLILAVFIGLSAAPMPLAWAMFIIGVVVDVIDCPVQDATILGPAALGYLFGAWAILQFRGLLFRQSPLALGAMTFIVGVFIHLVIVALFTIRGIPWIVGEPVDQWTAADQLYQRFLQLLYTAVLAVPLGVVLIRLDHLWGFGPGKHRAY
jgi:hypothetical protein